MPPRLRMRRVPPLERIDTQDEGGVTSLEDPATGAESSGSHGDQSRIRVRPASATTRSPLPWPVLPHPQDGSSGDGAGEVRSSVRPPTSLPSTASERGRSQTRADDPPLLPLTQVIALPDGTSIDFDDIEDSDSKMNLDLLPRELEVLKWNRRLCTKTLFNLMRARWLQEQNMPTKQSVGDFEKQYLQQIRDSSEVGIVRTFEEWYPGMLKMLAEMDVETAMENFMADALKPGHHWRFDFKPFMDRRLESFDPIAVSPPLIASELASREQQIADQKMAIRADTERTKHRRQAAEHERFSKDVAGQIEKEMETVEARQRGRRPPRLMSSPDELVFRTR